MTLILQRSLLLALAAALVGCSIYSVPQSGRAPVETRPDPTVVTPGSPAPGGSALPEAEPNVVRAYSALVAQAEGATARGDYDQALALLERAQRIDPESAEIYLHLARTYASQGQMAQSRATASRGTLYCRNESECDALHALAR
ncbi:hypothetical protein CWI75_17550 [Kineobactrum sediminis]|uniref:Uncharacterized protein n=1 Tax=Kineobactrum sediminis TaxID=1905677 RepID=A0A2N5XY65_9GAMM|nr:tetratricopeptide repeat protein [Kineobactrum sediminis]PLW81087.1 hypothetical protein CWI75_17550 [Kineobactrum sediminis]